MKKHLILCLFLVCSEVYGAPTPTPVMIKTLRVETLYVETIKNVHDGSNVAQCNPTRTMFGETGQRVIIMSSDLTLSADGPITYDGDQKHVFWLRDITKTPDRGYITFLNHAGETLATFRGFVEKKLKSIAGFNDYSGWKYGPGIQNPSGNVLTGSGTPPTPPPSIGCMYIDTVTETVYVSVSLKRWKKLP